MALGEGSTTSCSTMMSQRARICRTAGRPALLSTTQEGSEVPEELALATDVVESVTVCWLWPTDSSGTRKDLGENGVPCPPTLQGKRLRPTPREALARCLCTHVPSFLRHALGQAGLGALCLVVFRSAASLQ